MNHHPRATPAGGPRRPSRGPWCALAALGAVAVARLVPPWTPGLVGVQAVAAPALLPAWPLLGWAVVRRHPAAFPAAGLAFAQLALVRATTGRGRPDPAPEDGAALRLVTANLLTDNPSVDRLGRELAASGADVVVVQELTSDHAAALADGDVGVSHPYAVLDPREGFHGSGIWSRYPVAVARTLTVDDVPMAGADLHTPAGPVRVVAVHATNPAGGRGVATWERQLAALATYATTARMPVLLAGDFNATLDHRPLRAMLRTGLREAFRVAGRGPGPTWPQWRSGTPGASGPRRAVPPLLRLDHVIVTPGVAVRTARTVASPGSDHRRVEVDLVVPRS